MIKLIILMLFITYTTSAVVINTGFSIYNITQAIQANPTATLFELASGTYGCNITGFVIPAGRDLTFRPVSGGTVLFSCTNGGTVAAPANNSRVVFENLSFTNCTTSCIKSAGAEVHINRCTFYDGYCTSNNYYYYETYAMVADVSPPLTPSGTITITNSLFYNTRNTSHCRAIQVTSSASFTMTNTEFNNFNATQTQSSYDNAVRAMINVLSLGDVTMTNITLNRVHTVSSYANTMYIKTNRSVTLTKITSNNSGKYYIDCQRDNLMAPTGHSVVIRNFAVYEFSTSASDGGAFYFNGGEVILLEDVTIVSNITQSNMIYVNGPNTLTSKLTFNRVSIDSRMNGYAVYFVYVANVSFSNTVLNCTTDSSCIYGSSSNYMLQNFSMTNTTVYGYNGRSSNAIIYVGDVQSYFVSKLYVYGYTGTSSYVIYASNATGIIEDLQILCNISSTYSVVYLYKCGPFSVNRIKTDNITTKILETNPRLGSELYINGWNAMTSGTFVDYQLSNSAMSEQSKINITNCVFGLVNGSYYVPVAVTFGGRVYINNITFNGYNQYSNGNLRVYYSYYCVITNIIGGGVNIDQSYQQPVHFFISNITTYAEHILYFALKLSLSNYKDWTTESRINGVYVYNSQLRTTNSLVSVAGGQYSGVAFSLSNIVITGVRCFPEIGTSTRLVSLSMPTNITNLLIHDSHSYLGLVMTDSIYVPYHRPIWRNVMISSGFYQYSAIRMYHAFTWSNVTVTNNTGRSLVIIDVPTSSIMESEFDSFTMSYNFGVDYLFTLNLNTTAEYPRIKSSNFVVECNWLNTTSDSTSVIMYNAHPINVLNIQRMAGNLVHPAGALTYTYSSNPMRRRYMYQGSAEVSVIDPYYMYLYNITMVPHSEGGDTISVFGHYIATHSQTVSVEYEGVAARRVLYSYTNEVTFVTDNGPGDGSGRVVLVASNGTKGLVCNAPSYNNNVPVSISQGEFAFSDAQPLVGYSDVSTRVALLGTWPAKSQISLRCVFNETYNGEWYTPANSTDIYCDTPPVPLGRYSVKIQVRAGTTLSFSTYWSFVVQQSPVIESVSELQLFTYYPVQIFGSGFSETDNWRCKYQIYNLSYANISQAVESDNVTYVSSSQIECNVPELPFNRGSQIALYVSPDNGSTWYEAPRRIRTEQHYRFYLYDPFSYTDGFVYVRDWVIFDGNYTSSSYTLWTIGKREPSFSYSTSNHMYLSWVDSKSTPLYCMTLTQDGLLTFTQAVVSSSCSPLCYLNIYCSFAPSVNSTLQKGWVSIGYSMRYRYQITQPITYVKFDLQGVYFNKIRNNAYIYLKGNIDHSGYNGVGCSSSGCTCRFSFNTTSGMRTVSSSLERYNTINSYRCTLPVSTYIPTTDLTMYLYLQENVLFPNGNVTVKLDNTTLVPDDFWIQSGQLGQVVDVPVTGFEASEFSVCSWVRFKDGEAPATPGGREVVCGNQTTNLFVIYSFATYFNGTHVGCIFSNFTWYRSDYYREMNTTDDQLVCYGAFYTIGVGNNLEDTVLAPNMFQYIGVAAANATDPSSGSRRHIEFVTVSGINIARLGTPTCWWVGLLPGGITPPSPDQVPGGIYSNVTAGTLVFSSAGSQVKCPLPMVENTARLALFISNNGIQYNYSARANFSYVTAFILNIEVAPSSVSYNRVPLAVQPVVRVTDIEGNNVDPLRVVDVVARVNPTAVTITGNSARLFGNTSMANFTDLKIELKQNINYSVCFQASAVDATSEWMCGPYITAAPCPEILANSVDYNGLCKCDQGFEFNVFQECQVCRSGTYRNDLSEILCTLCPDLMITNRTGSINASECHCVLGFTEIDNQCHCSLGYYYEASASSCWPCADGYYKNNTGLGQCTKCPSNMGTKSVGAKNISECACKEGSYKIQGYCLKCPDGAQCYGNDALPIALPGYFASATASDVFIKCNNPSACIGSSECKEGYTGYQCGACETGYYRRGSNCVECGGLANVIMYVSIVAVWVVLGVVFWLNYMPTAQTRFAAMRVGWSFIQVTALYAQFDLKWPKEIKMIYNYLSFVMLDIQITSPECSIGSRIDFFVFFLFKLAIPIIFAVLLILVLLTSILVITIYRKRKGLAKQSKSHLWNAYVRSVFMLGVMFYVPLCNFTLQYFDCTHQPDGTWTLDAEPSAYCYQGKHASFIYYALYGVVVYMIGVPLFVFTLLKQNKDKLYQSQVINERYGFLFARFRPECYFWEGIILIRLCMLTFCLIMMNTYVSIQTMLGLIVLFFAALYHKDYKPFISKYLNSLETASIVASVLTLLAGQVFYTEIDNVAATKIITYSVIALLVINLTFVGIVIYLDWVPPEDVNKDFSVAAQESFETVSAAATVGTISYSVSETMNDQPEEMSTFVMDTVR